MKRNTGYTAAVLLIAVSAAGCAGTTERPVEAIAKAETSIELAEQAGARDYSAVALDSAKENLSNARVAAERGDYEQAQRLAVEAELDAEYASAQASNGKANDALAEVDESIRTLRAEIERNQTKQGE